MVAGVRGVVDDIIIGAATLVALRVTKASSIWIRVNAAIAALAVALATTGSLIDSELLLQFANLVSGYLLLVVFVSLLVYVIRQTHVTGDTLFGALAVYLAVGVLFGGLFTMIALQSPAAFDPPEFVKFGGETVLYYYSFVTLTTLGFGDITPLSHLARILTTIESLTGLVILGVLVGRVVGLLVSQQANTDTDRKLAAIEDKVDGLSNQLRATTPGEGR